MQSAPTLRPTQALWRRYPLLTFTVLTALGCMVLVQWLDKPVALWLHYHATGAVPFFEWATNTADTALAATFVGGRPMLFIGLGLAYLLGRLVLRQRWATVFLLVLLTYLSSIVSASLLQVAVHRPRPEVLFTPGVGVSFSFPSLHTATYWSLFWPLALAFPRWRGPLLLVPVLIALGRLVLGEHYPSDVWAAIWLVVAWAALWQWLLRLGGLGLRRLRG